MQCIDFADRTANRTKLTAQQDDAQKPDEDQDASERDDDYATERTFVWRRIMSVVDAANVLVEWEPTADGESLT